jgi:uncharacterized cupin superfamily protein
MISFLRSKAFAGSLLAMLAFCVGFVAAQAGGVKGGSNYHWQLHQLTWVPVKYPPDLPLMKGTQAALFTSRDGTRWCAAVRESGHAHATFPVDQIGYVISGQVKVTLQSGEQFSLVRGDVFHFHPGVVAEMEVSPDFSDIACGIS